MATSQESEIVSIKCDPDLDLNIVSIKCDHCNISFDSEEEWDLHLKSGHSADDQVLISSLLALASDPGPSNLQGSDPNNVYLCGECSSEFMTAEECAHHVTVSHPKQQQQSIHISTVSKISNSRTSDGPFILKSTEKTKKGKPINTITSKGQDFKCNIKGCPYYFSTIERVQVHVSCHQDQGGFMCQIEDCHCLFDKWKKCSLHLWRKHNLDLDLYSCSLCPGLKLANPHDVEIHNQTHSDERNFVCSVCLKGFKQYTQFCNHAVTHMDKSSTAVPNWFRKKECELCNKYFADSKCLKKHVQAVHSKLKPYICNVCNHQCARKAMLEMHMRQHTGEKPYECDLCQYRTGDHNSLRRHKMRHSGEKPYRCNLCPYGAIQSAAFKRHMKIKHKAE